MKLKMHCSLFLSGIVEIEWEPGQTFVQAKFVGVEPLFVPACVSVSKDGLLDAQTGAEFSTYAAHLLLKHQLALLNELIEKGSANILAGQAAPEGGVKA
jgi:hypothetical protein